ncbi:hypothetical protein AB0H73_18535 [Streptomyces olivoreticuli]
MIRQRHKRLRHRHTVTRGAMETGVGLAVGGGLLALCVAVGWLYVHGAPGVGG